MRREVSLSTPLDHNSDNSTLGESIADDNSSDPFDDNDVISDREYLENLLIITSLKEQERKVVKERYLAGDGVVHTLEELGQRYDITRERIRQIEEKALEKISKKANAIANSGMPLSSLVKTKMEELKASIIGEVNGQYTCSEEDMLANFQVCNEWISAADYLCISDESGKTSGVLVSFSFLHKLSRDASLPKSKTLSMIDFRTKLQKSGQQSDSVFIIKKGRKPALAFLTADILDKVTPFMADVKQKKTDVKENQKSVAPTVQKNVPEPEKQAALITAVSEQETESQKDKSQTVTSLFEKSKTLRHKNRKSKKEDAASPAVQEGIIEKASKYLSLSSSEIGQHYQKILEWMEEHQNPVLVKSEAGEFEAVLSPVEMAEQFSEQLNYRKIIISGSSLKGGWKQIANRVDTGATIYFSSRRNMVGACLPKNSILHLPEPTVAPPLNIGLSVVDARQDFKNAHVSSMDIFEIELKHSSNPLNVLNAIDDAIAGIDISAEKTSVIKTPDTAIYVTADQNMIDYFVQRKADQTSQLSNDNEQDVCLALAFREAQKEKFAIIFVEDRMLAFFGDSQAMATFRNIERILGKNHETKSPSKGIYND